MRRNDREITDINAINEFISREQIIRIAFYDNGDIYIVPVNYGYVYENGHGVLFFHGAKAGRKFELAQNNPLVGFEIDGKYELMEADIACDYSAHFQSVIGNGTLTILNDDNEKTIGLNALMSQVNHTKNFTYDKSMLDSVAVFKLDIKQMSCKAK